jgi:hypothetical protein
MGAAALPIMIGTTLLAAGVGAAGQIQAGRAAKAQAEYQAKVAENNSVIAQRKADDAIKRGEIDEQQQRVKTAQLIGAQRASSAARGVVVDEGSALDITQDTAAIGELDALTIRNNATREALGFEYESQSFTNEAQLRQMAGRQAQTSSYYGAAGTLLSSGSTVADRWYKLR